MNNPDLIARATAFLKVRPIDPIEAINLVVELTNEKLEQGLESIDLIRHHQIDSLNSLVSSNIPAATHQK